MPEEETGAEIVEIVEEPDMPDAQSASLELAIDLPEDRDEAIQVLIDAVATSQTAASRYLDDLQRLAAEYENYRKRMQRDRTELIERASQRVIESLLPVLDSFDHAFLHEAQTSGEEQLLAGVRGTYQQLMDLLGKEGLEPVAGAGEPFDPNVHEAVSGGGDGDLIVAQELRRGYIHNGRVIRPSLVVVADAAAGESDPSA